VFSAFLGKPFVAVALTEKTKSLVRDFSWEKFSVGPGFKAAELAEKTLGLFRKQEKASLLIGKKRQELKQKALRAFVLFEEKLLLAGSKG